MSLTPHPTLPGLLADPGVVADTEQSWPVAGSETIHSSPYLSLTLDTIVDPTGAEHQRAVVRPHGAVGIVALDAEQRVLLVEQYRHAVGRRLLEIPAGTLDVVGESPRDAAARELSEEGDVVATSWLSLLRLSATPGYSSESWEVFLATGLTPTPDADRTTREAEEADMRQLWVPLEAAVAAIVAGRVSDAMTVAGILAVARRVPGRRA